MSDVVTGNTASPLIASDTIVVSSELSPLLLLSSPFGDDRLPFQQSTLHAVGLTAEERLSAPFEIEIIVVSTERAIDPDELLYHPVAISVRRKDGIDRPFHGIVRRMDSVAVEQRGRWQYRLEVVPRLWFLSQSIDCRIFQQRTTVQILEELFSEHQVRPVEFRIVGTQTVRPYTTQYNESDLAFAQRIMQENGYFYFFEHSASQHTLVVTDGNQAFKIQPEPVHRVIYRGDNVDIFDSWIETLQTAYGSVEIQDYDPERPRNPVAGQQTTQLSTAGAGNRQVYRWPAMTIDNQVAADRARFRIEAAEAEACLCKGHGYDPNLCPGFRFTLATDPVTRSENVDYVVHSTRHSATDETWLAGTSAPKFDCSFTCFPKSVTWRDDLSIPRPAMTGIFSGIVLGESGEEIHSDNLARVKVQPLFDHRKDTTAAQSIFIRILHAWAGDRWGWQHIPRVGTEVGISFMNGDPDNPVVVGSFYHEEMPPVFPVPEQQTKQGFRSRSTLQGGTQDYNELSFDDRKGQELVLLHAQKDHKIEVENDQNASIGNDRTITTQGDDSLTTVLGDISVRALGGQISIQAMVGSINIQADSLLGAVTISAKEHITLTVGASTITITPENILIATPSLVVTGGETVIATPEFIAPPPGL